MKTKKMYYEDMFLSECEGTVIAITEKGIILDQTVAFAEGGGQIGDIGILKINKLEIPFNDTKKGVGQIIHLDNFPSIQVNTPVIHVVDTSNREIFRVGDKVIVKINIQHRIRTSVLHSALHVVLMVARERCSEVTKIIKGCKITTESARIDFFSNKKFTIEDIKEISRQSQVLIEKKLKIKTYIYDGQDEAWYWQCENFICPCGGTHVENTGDLGILNVRRKNVGKTTERLIVTVSNELISEKYYH